jgi:hypothetical protein
MVVGVDYNTLSKISAISDRGKISYLSEIFKQDKAAFKFPFSNPKDLDLFGRDDESSIYSHIPAVLSCNWLWHYAWSIVDPITSSLGLFKSLYDIVKRKQSGIDRIDPMHFATRVLDRVERLENKERSEWFDFCVLLVTEAANRDELLGVLSSRVESVASRLVSCWCIRKNVELWQKTREIGVWDFQPDQLDPGLIALINLGELMKYSNL